MKVLVRTLLSGSIAVVTGLSAAAAAPSTPFDKPTSKQVHRQVVGVAQQIKDLTSAYEQHQEKARQAANQFADTLRAMNQAEKARDEAYAKLQETQAQQYSHIQVQYVAGGISPSLSLLTSDAGSGVLTNMSLGEQVSANALSTLQRSALDYEQQAQEASRLQVAADKANAAANALFGTMQNESAMAQQSLQQAQRKLKDLSTKERRLAASERAAAAAAAARLAAAQAAAQSASLASTTPVTAMGIPVEFLKTYQAAAATCPSMRWTLLAAVGQVETGHGRNNGPSSAGAIGPMQFMPGTFKIYGVDGNKDGVADAWNYADAIYSAAHYLCSSGVKTGTPEGVQKALFAYNHSQWYVDLVLRTEQAIIANPPQPAGTKPAKPAGP